MKLVRNKVFETNSSSCHSVTIAEKTGVYASLPVNEEGIVFIDSGEFGWEQETYSDAATKASYLAVYIRDWAGDKQQDFKEIFEALLKEHTGCDTVEYKEKFWAEEERHWKNGEAYMVKLGGGYIDHQSVEDNDYHYLFENVALLKEFIFNPGSVLETDSDNC